MYSGQVIKQYKSPLKRVPDKKVPENNSFTNNIVYIKRSIRNK